MKIYTSESVSIGHPDKLADQISDALLDAFLNEDKKLGHQANTRVAVETLLTRGVAVVAGEVRTEGYVDVAKVVRETITDAGYTDTDYGFDGRTCGVLVAIQEQSAHIAMGVDTGGAGDQGMMFGYATNETPELMPLPIAIAHALTRKSTEVRQSNRDLGLRPDAKSQVSVEYDADGRPTRINTVVLSQQHSPKLDLKTVQEIVHEHVIKPVLAQYSEYVNGEIIYHVNPTGKFEIGGPQGDTGVTGRKIIVDTYGGMAPHGGGAFSGKDPTKVDRSAAYIARYLAKNIVAAGLAERCVLTLAYAIGVAQPVAINVETFGTETVTHDEIIKRVRANYDLSPAGIVKALDLLSVKYLPTAQNGHFGNPAFPWEGTASSGKLQ
jgi:S-adenosylmethionine synthetase